MYGPLFPAPSGAVPRPATSAHGTRGGCARHPPAEHHVLATGRFHETRSHGRPGRIGPLALFAVASCTVSFAQPATPASPAPAATGTPAKTETSAHKATTTTKSATHSSTASHSSTTSHASNSSKAATTPKLDLNSASKEELAKIPTIGESLADKIVAARPYKSSKELVSKGVLTQKEYDKVHMHLTVKPS
jgi:DNA uptake protein ComE-like DNA-binding protein